jgi:hypothetical protein
MPSKIYASPADNLLPSKPRTPLFSAVALVWFAMLAVITLVLIFPKQELTEKVTLAKLGDPVTVSYLTNLLRTDPNNLALRLLLAEHKLYMGKINDVPGLLEPVLRDTQSEWHMKAQLVELRYLSQLSELNKQNPAQLAHILAIRRSKLQYLILQPWSQEIKEYLALQALSLNEPNLAGGLYRSIAKSNETIRTDWYAEVAAHMLAAGEYELAAEFYFMARHKAVLRTEQRRFFYAGINALMANSLFSEAMQAADRHLGNLSDDPDTLYFLARAALAANDTKRAERYVKRLLHLSWLDDLACRLQALNFSFINTAYANDQVSNLPVAQDMSAYHAEHYDLAYQVFLANRNLNDAFRVADSAVRQVPDSLLWHRRLAQVSEWAGKPDVALREWSWLMSHGGGQEAWLAVLRLAPGLQDNQALLTAWIYLASKQALDKEQAGTLAELFEKTARNQEGVAFFEQRYEQTNDPLWLEMSAYLAERAGDEITAQHGYERLLEQHGFNSEKLLRLVKFKINQGHLQSALAMLLTHRSKIQSSDKPFWKLLADLSWQLQRDEDAKTAYQQLALADQLALEDISRFIYLLGDSQPKQVAALAELGYQKFVDRDMLLYALDVYGTLHDRQAQQRLFESAAKNNTINLQSSAHFLLLRAQYQYESGFLNEARADFLHAAKLAPNDQNVINPLLWFLIDTHDQKRLRGLIERLVARGAQRNPAYWAAFAAGYQVLEQPQLALSYFSAELKRQPQDFLWLVNYADALEQSGQRELASRTRRNAWQQLRIQRPGATVSLPLTADLQAVVRLIVLTKPHDPAHALMRSLLRQDRLVKQTPADQELINQILLAWALSNEQHDNAKAWLWQRYTRSLVTGNGQAGVGVSASGNPVKPLSAPVWAESLIALAEEDTEQLDKLFQQHSNNIPVHNRSDAAEAIGSLGGAQTIVFEGLTHNPDDEELQSRQRNYDLATSSFVEMTLDHLQLASWQGSQSRLVLEMPISPTTRVGLLLSNTRQSDLNSAQVTPRQEQVEGVLVKVKNSLGNSELQWQKRQEFAATDALILNHVWQADARLELQAHGLYHADTVDSLALRTVGMQNGLSSSVLYRFGRREYLRFQPGMSDYFTQQGTHLGSGMQLAWEIGYHVRSDYPDWTVSLSNSKQIMRPLPAGIGVLPNNDQLYALCSNLGQSIQAQYSHAWHPYLNTCLTSNPESGLGYNANFGWAGSLLGRDQVTVSFGQGMSGAIFNQGMTREVTLRYRYLFDRY